MSPARPRLDIALAIPVRDERVLVARRAAGGHLAGHWEFPGGKVERDERPAAAAVRELLEETGLAAGTLEPLDVLAYDYPERALRFHVFVACDPEGTVKMNGGREFAWKTWAELQRLEMPPANREMLPALESRLASGSV